MEGNPQLHSEFKASLCSLRCFTQQQKCRTKDEGGRRQPGQCAVPCTLKTVFLGRWLCPRRHAFPAALALWDLSYFLSYFQGHRHLSPDSAHSQLRVSGQMPCEGSRRTLDVSVSAPSWFLRAVFIQRARKCKAVPRFVVLGFCFVFYSKTESEYCKNRSIGKTFNRDLGENLNLENAFAFVSGKLEAQTSLKDERRLLRCCRLGSQSWSGRCWQALPADVFPRGMDDGQIAHFAPEAGSVCLGPSGGGSSWWWEPWRCLQLSAPCDPSASPLEAAERGSGHAPAKSPGSAVGRLRSQTVHHASGRRAHFLGLMLSRHDELSWERAKATTLQEFSAGTE